MIAPKEITPRDRAVVKYYSKMRQLNAQKATREQHLKSVFAELLSAVADRRGWTLIQDQSKRKGDKKLIRPDGTVRDANHLPRGHWEAKDLYGNLERKIAEKKEAGYPLQNIIFENTGLGVLYQNNAEAFRADLTKPAELCDLVNRFFAYEEPNIEGFEEALGIFAARVPDLARGLADKLKEAHSKNKVFQQAFDELYQLCKESLHPDIPRETIDDMLMQHILTERVIRRIFNNPEFVKRNVVAERIEDVLAALYSKAFSRDEYLKSLDTFYVAIENAAATLSEYSDKQQLLNTIYERFFQGYSIGLSEAMGIVYTPQQIVDFMCESVQWALGNFFGLTYDDEQVVLLDPCTGTGNYVCNILQRVAPQALENKYRNSIFANEIMLLPYYIASLNIEHQFYEQTGDYASFEGLCFVDTLLLAEKQTRLGFLAERNSVRVERQKKAPVTVIVGNPPYRQRQQNEDDNNKNRRYPAIEKKIKDTFGKDSQSTNRNALADPYVKFFRWAIDRIGQRDGIVCYITNNKFVRGRAFDGMRKHLAREFDAIFHVDLRGDRRENPKLSGTKHNVFGIANGVGITLAVRKADTDPMKRKAVIEYHFVDEQWTRYKKLDWLEAIGSIERVEFQRIVPDGKNSWFSPRHGSAFSKLMPLTARGHRGAKVRNPKAVFEVASPGLKTNRDAYVFDFDRELLCRRMETFVDAYNAQLDKYKRRGRPKEVDAFVEAGTVKWDSTLKKHLARLTEGVFSESHVRLALYRPFTLQYLYFDRLFINSVHGFADFFPEKNPAFKNPLIAVSGPGHDRFMCVGAHYIVELKCANRENGGSHCFPLYLCDDKDGKKRDNITDWALEKWQQHYGDKSITKRQIFDYVYGMLHADAYLARYAESLRTELPHVPMVSNFDEVVRVGAELFKLHAEFESVVRFPLKRQWAKGVRPTTHVDRMKLAKDGCSLWVNDSLVLAGIPAHASEWVLGGRTPLAWVVDQYRVTKDSASGLVADPNDESHPNAILELLERVVTVSCETVDRLNGLRKIVRSKDI